MALTTGSTLAEAVFELTEYTGINQKADLVSLIGSPAATSQSMVNLIAMLQTDKNNIAAKLTTLGQACSGTDSMDTLYSKLNAVNPLKWATGTATSDGGGIFNIYSLGFRPKLVLFWTTSNNMAIGFYQTYYASSPIINYVSYMNLSTVTTVTYSLISSVSIIDNSILNLKFVANAPVTWLAIE